MLEEAELEETIRRGEQQIQEMKQRVIQVCVCLCMRMCMYRVVYVRVCVCVCVCVCVLMSASDCRGQS